MGMKPLNVEFTIPMSVLEEARAFFQVKGQDGCEGTGLLIGVFRDTTHASVTRVFFPEQVATKSRWGVAVDLTERAHYTLPDELKDNERFLARIHSHPEEAYHSERDNENQVVSHKGAISIVVPFFGRDSIDLQDCAVYVLDHIEGWIQLSIEEIEQHFKII
jgi:hypothetical protein